MTAITINIPNHEVNFFKKVISRMGWTISYPSTPDALYDPESGEYLNEETMQAIHDVESGKTTRCKDFKDILALV